MKIIQQESYILKEGLKENKNRIATVYFSKDFGYWRFVKTDFNITGTYDYYDWMFLGEVSRFIEKRLFITEMIEKKADELKLKFESQKLKKKLRKTSNEHISI